MDSYKYRELATIIESIPLSAEPPEILRILERLKGTDLNKGGGSLEAVQIMTVHRSKGLEFEVVFALGISTRTVMGEIGTEEREAEKLRQLYVAVTRAKSQLYIPLLIEATGKKPKSSELSSFEAFFEAATPDLSLFSHLDLNQFEFGLNRFDNRATFEAKNKGEKPPLPLASFIESPPVSIHSFSSLFKGEYKRGGFERNSFPDGLETGLIVHRILERFFNREGKLFELIREETASTLLQTYQYELLELLEKALEIDLGGFSLGHVKHALPEVEFVFKAGENSYTTGSIDLCIEYENSYYLVDWKTHLLPDYSPNTLQEVMVKNHYLAQAHMYGTAFQRYLRLHRKEGVFKGAFFFFLRGSTTYLVPAEGFRSEGIPSLTVS